ncbi:MAG: hypothetical protein ACD_73C00755G0003 [uncultured bacterium]|nr:MAG: hypothetical protein ACD_73C00755G0003 [uncultured bacterium]
MNSLKLSDFDYTYPEDLVASHPLPQRDASQLMVLNRIHQTTRHHHFKEIAGFFKKGDMLILNNSKVFPCRLITKRKTGGKVEIFLVRPIKENQWEVLMTPAKKINCGDQFYFDHNLSVEVLDDYRKDGLRTLQINYDGNLYSVLDLVGHVPIPPYLNRDADKEFDPIRYQTIFADKIGSVAAPTAGFHFTEEILAQLRNLGVEVYFLTLHVGLGTFLPIRTDMITQHKMHGEFYDIPGPTAQAIGLAKKEKRRVTVVGTTAMRALESAASGSLGYTEKFIYPPYEFKVADRLITNFHQPKSTLLVLVSAFAGREFILQAYHEAIDNRYRLFSYGDAMMIE